MIPPRRAGRADLRLGGRWTARQRLKNDALWTAARVLLAAARPWSARALRAAGRLAGAVAYGVCADARRAAFENVARVFPRLDARERRAFVRRCFTTLGAFLGDTVAMLGPRPPPPLPLDEASRGVLDEARREGRGVVFASAHLGPWERVAASLVAAGVPLVTVARESYDPRFSKLYGRLRDAHGVAVVWRARAGAAVHIVRTLRRGEVLGVPMDLRGRVASCPAPFLGHQAPTALGPARIALRTGAAVVVGSAAPATRESDGRLEVTVTRIATHDLPRGSTAAAQLTARINDEISRRILAMPHAWVWMHRRWTTRTGV